MHSLRTTSILWFVLLTAGSHTDATSLLPNTVSALGLVTHRKHERSDEIKALPGFDGRMPSRQYGDYVTGRLCFPQR